MKINNYILESYFNCEYKAYKILKNKTIDKNEFNIINFKENKCYFFNYFNLLYNLYKV